MKGMQNYACPELRTKDISPQNNKFPTSFFDLKASKGSQHDYRITCSWCTRGGDPLTPRCQAFWESAIINLFSGAQEIHENIMRINLPNIVMIQIPLTRGFLQILK